MATWNANRCSLYKVITQEIPTSFYPDASYLVVGGLKGIGREVARWMAEKGAQNLILISRNAEELDTLWLQTELSTAGARALMRSCDVADKDQLQQLVTYCAKQGMPPIRGVIHAAVLLQDSVFSNMSIEQWQATLQAKYQGTKNLDDQFDSPDQHFFILLSSSAGIIGSPGQANYTAGVTYQDALARNRVARGLPAVSLDLGSVLSVGIAARTTWAHERIAKAGYRFHTVDDVLRFIELAIRQPRRMEMLTGIVPWVTPGELPWRQEPRFACLWLRDNSNRSTLGQTQSGSLASSLRNRLRAASSTSLVDILIEALKSRLAEMFVLATSDIDPSQPLSKYGVDSLVAVELRNWLGGSVTPNLSIFDVTQSVSLYDLARRVADKYCQGLKEVDHVKAT